MISIYMILALIAKVVLQAELQITTTGTFFHQITTDDEDQSTLAGQSIIIPEFFECGSKESCTNIVKFKDTNKYQLVFGEAELLKINRPVILWAKANKDNSSKNQTNWIVIQRRIDNSTNFDRNWAEYKTGFGNAAGNMWIGLEKLHALAAPGKGAMLNITMKHHQDGDKVFYAQYTTFEIGNETDGYRLRVGGYSGNAGGSLVDGHNLMKFSTFDRDNDISVEQNCAQLYKGGWWYAGCHTSNLNSWYPTYPLVSEIGNYMSWFFIHSSYGNITFSEMKIKVPK